MMMMMMMMMADKKKTTTTTMTGLLSLSLSTPSLLEKDNEIESYIFF